MTKLASVGRSLCAALLLSSLFMNASAQTLTEDERQARLKELRSTIEQLKVELTKVKSTRQDLLGELQESETKIGELSKKVQELRKQLDDKQSHLKQLSSEKEELLTAKKQQQGSVARHLDAAYRLGQQNSLKLLLNQEDPSLLSRNLHYYGYFTRAQADQVGRYTATIQRIEALEPAIVAETEAISRSHAELVTKRNQLVSAQSERKRTLAKLERTIADTDAKLKSADEDRQHLERLLKEVARIASHMQLPPGNHPFSKLKGQLPWPTNGKVLRNFGSPRVANKIRWQGVLISAPEGNPVYAVHQGRVVFADYLRGQGLLLIIDHGAGFMSLYAHNQSLFKNLGDWVNAGEHVASVGQSGGQASSGLYFELRYKGEPTDPRPWLRKAA